MRANAIDITDNGVSCKKKLKRRNPFSEILVKIILSLFAGISILTTIAIIIILCKETLGFFQEVSIKEFLTGTEWTALFNPPKFGVLPLLIGTMMISIIGSLIALPIGLGSAIYLSEYASERTRKILKPILEILAGVPTIVYGYFALTFITPVIRNIFPSANVFNALSASIAVGIMIIPMVSSLSEDAMRAVPDSLRQGAYALGCTKLEVATKVVMPAALSSIISSFVLAVSRAIGETMIVTLAAGSMPKFTFNPLENVQTMTAFIVQVASGDVVHGGLAYKTIFAVGMLLFIITLGMNILSRIIIKKYKEEY
ncbi:phosphate ABC transporter, permease protein PstC [Gottschalkia purinilytica]|uniref:Phosphate transport system permease protein n=1 Tax=Gottschalkia purinilytica TaxID=1503 RepID=A0A0L0WEN5_GOTPU|nr:phosphate ABC transporter permease subunit PstC [Gottschalkia purinilytica]KNF09938.1 phosphate ABC transporter, permease protein PstC [Gottschalkia purinilytica]